MINNSLINNTQINYQNNDQLIGRPSSPDNENQLRTSPISHATEQHNSPEIYLSNRSTKLNALSKEFFSGDASTINTQKLIQRAFEYGLINQQEYDSLNGADTQPTGVDKTAQPQNHTTSLASYLTGLIEQLEKAYSDADEEKKQQVNETIDKLNKTKDMLKDVEKAKLTPTFTEDLNASIAALNNIVHSESFMSMPSEDKAGLSQTAKALEIINMLTPQRLTNDKVNQYLKVYQG